LVYAKKYSKKSEAFAEERRIKKMKSRKYIEKQINTGYYVPIWIGKIGILSENLPTLTMTYNQNYELVKE